MNNSVEFSVSNLVKSYNKSNVLDISEMKINSGQFIALMGKNGSGKSTLMRLLAQQELFDSGDIAFGGVSLQSTQVNLNDQMAFISEEHELPFPVNLNYWINIYRNLYPSFNESIFKNLVQKLEIDIEKSFHSLSRGQKMKALFCLQAPKRPNIYLLDEITAVLDAGSRWTLMQFLKEEVSRGCLVVMSTNIASEMHGFATHLTFLEKGKVIFSSDSGSISDHFRKIRVSKEKEASLPPNLFAKRISYNGDGTWIYMFKKSYNAAPIGIEDDAREITISDVQSYFTTEEGAV